MKFFDLRSVSLCKFIFCGYILTFLPFFGHPIISGSLKAVRHDSFRPESFENSFLTTFKEKSRIFRVGQWGDRVANKIRGIAA